MELDNKFVFIMVAIFLGGAVISYTYVTYYWESSRFDSLMFLALAFGADITLWPGLAIGMDKKQSLSEQVRSSWEDVRDSLQEELQSTLWAGLFVIFGIVLAFIYLPVGEILAFLMIFGLFLGAMIAGWLVGRLLRMMYRKLFLKE